MSLGPTEAERIAYYRDLAAQFRGWADDETEVDPVSGTTGAGLLIGSAAAPTF
jgi:hypothetical protein